MHEFWVTTYLPEAERADRETTLLQNDWKWDLYGTFCFVPTEEDTLHELHTSNENLAAEISRTSFPSRRIAQRPLDIHFITLSFIYGSEIFCL